MRCWIACCSAPRVQHHVHETCPADEIADHPEARSKQHPTGRQDSCTWQAGPYSPGHPKSYWMSSPKSTDFRVCTLFLAACTRLWLTSRESASSKSYSSMTLAPSHRLTCFAGGTLAFANTVLDSGKSTTACTASRHVAQQVTTQRLA